MIKQPRLETPRLVLEPFKNEDLPEIFAYASHPEVSKFVPWESHKSIEDSQSFLNYVRQSTNAAEDKLFFIFAIRFKAVDKVIGSIDFKIVAPHCGRIDYALGFDYWNRGVMSEAAAAVRDWAFAAVPDLLRLQAFCVVENKGSSRVMEKIGMKRVGLREKGFLLKGQPVDVVDYAMTKL